MPPITPESAGCATLVPTSATRSLPRDAMALEEFPHYAGRVDFLLRPRVTQAIDANHSDFRTIRAGRVAHGGKWTSRVIEHHIALTSVKARPSVEGLGYALQPLRAATCCVAIIRVLSVG